MISRSTLLRLVAFFAVCASNSICADAIEPTLRDRTEYNKALTALLGGVGALRTADANGLKAVADYATKMAAISQMQQEVRKATLANDLQAAENFYAKKKLHAEYLESRIRERPDDNKIQELAQQTTPARLSMVPVSYVSFRIAWPQILCSATFEQEKQALDALWSQRTMDNSGAGSQNCQDVRMAVSVLLNSLKEHIRTMPPADYLVAKRFLESISHEAGFVVTPGMEAIAGSF